MPVLDIEELERMRTAPTFVELDAEDWRRSVAVVRRGLGRMIYVESPGGAPRDVDDLLEPISEMLASLLIDRCRDGCTVRVLTPIEDGR